MSLSVSHGLINQYRIIGTELRAYEIGIGSLRRILHLDYPQFYKDLFHVQTDPERRLRHGLAFIPVEVLASYLEDLLNIEIDEAKLFIDRERAPLSIARLGLLGVCLAACFGCFIAAEHLPPAIALAFTLFGAAPFALLWYLAPSDSASRRLLFAKAISREINHRRGGKGDRSMTAATILDRMLRPARVPDGFVSRTPSH